MKGQDVEAGDALKAVNRNSQILDLGDLLN